MRSEAKKSEGEVPTLLAFHLQHILTACAINIVRVMSWLDGERPGRTKYSAFVRLHKGIAA